MRIGEPARKHGVADADIRHAVRNTMRKVLLDDDLVMLIGPATDGALLEIGVLDIDGDDAVVNPCPTTTTQVPQVPRMR
jgi:hypothetical protein